MAIREVKVKIVGASPYSQSLAVVTPKNTGESHEAYERRIWPERMHVNEEGAVFIPPMAIKNCLSDVARYLSESVPGKGKATYTKHFEAGVMCADPWTLTSAGAAVKAADVKNTGERTAQNGEWCFVPADGKKGSGKRVWKCFPVFMPWEATGTIMLLDPILIDRPEKVKEYLEHAGKFIGVGRFRPRNGGFYGRFAVASFK